jgi:hypothetical protein
MSNNIYPAIIKAMSEIGPISKDKKNEQQGFKYRGIDDVMNALQPIMSKNGIFIVPEVLEHTREDRTSTKGNALIYSVCKMKYTFFADDGSYVSAVVVGEGMDSGDKSMNKAMAIAMKYACFQVFCIPTEEMKDPDGESHDLKPQNPPQQNKPVGNDNHAPGTNQSSKNDSTQPSDLEKRASKIYFTMTGNKEGQYGWPLETYKNWLKEFKNDGLISTDYGKKWTLQDIEFIESQIGELPF